MIYHIFKCYINVHVNGINSQQSEKVDGMREDKRGALIKPAELERRYVFEYGKCW